MNVSLNDGPVVVTLSRRNVEQLLAALDGFREDPESGLEPYLVRWCSTGNDRDGILLQVIAQEDAVHYGDREPGPGLEHLL